MRETGTKRFSDASAWQSAAGLALVRAVLAIVLMLQPPLARAGAKNGAETVDTALVLAVDVSESVNTERYALQMAGISKTFEDPEIQRMILSGPNHSMFVTLVEWSSKAFVSIPWTLITSPGDALAFAEKIQRTPRFENQFTCLARALQVVRDKVLPFLPVAANRTIVDVSGDGRDNCNTSPPVDAMRDQLVLAGATINGLPILEGDEAATLEDWYTQHVIGGPAAFLAPALGFPDFERAMKKKFVVEVSSRSP